MSFFGEQQPVRIRENSEEPEDASSALAHAHEQLHPQGDAGVPAQRQQADVAGHDGRAQQVLHRGRAVRVPIEDLQGESVASSLVWLLELTLKQHEQLDPHNVQFLSFNETRLKKNP